METQGKLKVDTEVRESTLEELIGDFPLWMHFINAGSQPVAVCGTTVRNLYPLGAHPERKRCPDCVRIAGKRWP